MKKVIIFLVVIIGLFAAIAVITKVQQNEKAEGNIYKKASLHPETIDQLNDPLYQNIILPDELEKKLKSGDDTTVYFYSPDCSFCKQTTPIVNPIAKKIDINLLQFNLKEFPEGRRNYGIEYTPTIVHFKNGKEQSRIVGAHTKEEFETYFNENVK
ncbi:thioredoxin family protein [Lederbergia citrea]|uniref:Thioredoxin family protein n=1 Tax=Lederbergia citrea TaxID=2833581 RepID=A0A942Z174_9BACI|nr:thioredoxin family protein [Lederbergia citrea]MBS4177553.1 thioredoxin family protein [Lederbergia citrea]MBS4204227.1 thioredoxin family protein [Lederbergia citrea]MBS4221188.1 thioredoxin family protein [Lederbergia citrea]